VAAWPPERRERALNLSIEHVLVGLAVARIGGDEARHLVAGNATEYGRVGDAVATQPVRPMHAARILAGDEKPGPIGRGVGPADDAAHEVMRRGHHLDQPAGAIEAA